MSPPEHALFGALAGTAIHAAQKKPGILHWIGCCALTAVASIAPDLDSGVNAYGSNNAWIGHRGWTHSLLFAALFGIAVLLGARRSPGKLFAPASAFACGFTGVCLHILGDMPTPPGSWGGLPVFFPHPARFGGFSNIGWYNPVLFWKVFVFFAAGAVFMAVGSFERIGRAARLVGGTIALCGFLFAVIDIAGSRYTDALAWHQDQERALRQMPWPVYPVTTELSRIGMQMFARLRAQ